MAIPVNNTQTGAHRVTMNPSEWIVRYAPLIGEGASILDLACGSGRNGRVFLGGGRKVTFVDIDTSGVQDLAGVRGVEILEADLEGSSHQGGGWPFGQKRFDCVIVVNYLWRPILDDICAAVAPGGILLYETFMIGNEAFGRPRSPDFLLNPGELVDAAGEDFHILAFEEGAVGTPPSAVKQALAARRKTQPHH